MSDRPATPGPRVGGLSSAAQPILVAYLHEHRHAYTREALTRQLVEAGHDPAAIEAAWVAVESSSSGRPSGSLAADLLTVLVMAAILLAYGGAGLLALLGASMGASGATYGVHPGVMLGYIATLLVAAGLAVRALVVHAPQARHRVLTVIGIALAAGIAFAGLSGLCVVALQIVR